MTARDWVFFIIGAFGGAGSMAIAFLHRVGPKPACQAPRKVPTFTSDAVTTVLRGRLH